MTAWCQMSTNTHLISTQEGKKKKKGGKPDKKRNEVISYGLQGLK
jgi:hypothetical protein